MMDPLRYQADHTLLLALPAFAPAVVVVGVVVYVAMRDRRRGEPRSDDCGEPRNDAQDEHTDSSGEDGSP